LIALLEDLVHEADAADPEVGDLHIRRKMATEQFVSYGRTESVVTEEDVAGAGHQSRRPAPSYLFHLVQSEMA
jgi:hypothetical protein